MDQTLVLPRLKPGHYYHRVGADGSVYFAWKILSCDELAMVILEVSLDSPYRREVTLDLTRGVWEHMTFTEISPLQGLLEVGE